MPDRSAGRFCRVCERHGDHHTDRHVWSVDELADQWRVSRMTVYRLVHDGTLGSFRVGHRIRIYQEHVDRYLARAAPLS